MPTTWLNNENTECGHDADRVLEHLAATGVLAKAEAMMAQDLADIAAGTVLDGTIGAREMRDLLAAAKF